MSSFLLVPSFLLLFFSSQLCDGRHLFMVFDDKIDHGSKMTKTGDVTYKNEDSLLKVENRPQVQLMGGKTEKRKIEHGKQILEGGKKSSECVDQKTDSMISGTESCKPSSHNVKWPPNRIEVSDRSTVEFNTQEEGYESIELDVSDVVVTDYPQPHRKPPINNKAP